MPRPSIDPRWHELIWSMVGERPKPTLKTILAQLGEASRISESHPQPLGKPPKARAVRYSIEKHKLLPPEEQRQYALFHWPGSLGSPDLPWEASAACLELLAYFQQANRWDPAHYASRPTIRLAKWFWRVTLAAPDAPFHYRRAVAVSLAISEVLPGGRPEIDARSGEGYLAYAPWRSKKALKNYQEALDAGLPRVKPPTELAASGAQPEVLEEWGRIRKQQKSSEKEASHDQATR